MTTIASMTAQPDLLASTSFSRVTSRIRTDLDRAALEMVTGQRSDIAVAVAGRTGQVERAMRAVDAPDAAISRLALAIGRYTQTDAALSVMRSLGEETRVGALTAINAGPGAAVKIAVEAEGALNGILGALNTSFDGRALFAGAASDAKPVGDASSLLAAAEAAMAGATTPAERRAALDDYFADGGAFDTAFYRGADDAAATLALPDGTTLGAIPRATDDGIKTLLEGLVVLATSPKLPPLAMSDWLAQGADLIARGGEGLIAAEAQIGVSLNRLDRAQLQLASERGDAERLLDRLIGKDTFEAASETQALEARLEAAYTVTSRLGRLSLTNYLR